MLFGMLCMLLPATSAAPAGFDFADGHAAVESLAAHVVAAAPDCQFDAEL